MSREPDNRTGGHYFDLDVLCGVSGEGEAFQSFLDRYGSYVFKRAADFSARFQVRTKFAVVCTCVWAVVSTAVVVF